jgi:hypothetical protein
MKIAAPTTSTAVGAKAFVQEALRSLPEVAAPDLGQSPVISDEVSSRDSRFASTFGAGIILADDNGAGATTCSLARTTLCDRDRRGWRASAGRCACQATLT